LTKTRDYAKFGGMKCRPKYILFLLIILLLCTQNAFAFWVWTPETNKWINPKYAVKETPAEQLQFALAYYEAGDYEKAIKAFKKLIKHYPRAREAPDAQYYIGLVLENQEEYFAAYKNYQDVIDRYPFSERAGEIVKRQYDIGVKLLEGLESRGKFMDALTGTDYNVVDVFRTVIKNAPYGDYAAPSQYKIGLYLLEKRLFQEARDEFEKVMNDFPNSEWAKVAKYQIAVADASRSTDPQYDQKITQAAVEEFEDFLENYPDAELSNDAKGQIQQLREKEAENNFVIAEFYEKQKNYKAAKIYYQIIVNEYRTSSWLPKALNKIREMSLKED